MSGRGTAVGIAMALLVLSIVVAIVLALTIVRFRERDPEALPRQVRGSATLELGWTVAPAIVLTFIAFPTVGAIFRTQAPPAADALASESLQYADILKVEPVTTKEKVYATVIGTEPVRETTQTTVPHEVCEDVVVEERLPERDGNVGGTVAGTVIGGLLGNQIGGGSGKKVATAAGAVAGGVIGNQVR